MLSVVIPALDAARVLPTQLEALARQDHEEPWEVIVADNGSRDATVEVASGWADRLPLRVVDASARAGPAAARNIGAAAVHGDLLAFTDADDVVLPGWLDAVRSLEGREVLASGPVLRFLDGEPPPSPRPGPHRPFRHMSFLPYADGANLFVARRVFERHGGFRERFRAGEDAELSWRLQLAGVPFELVPGAQIGSRVRRVSMATFRQYRGYGVGDVDLYREFAAAGLQRPSVVSALRSYAGILLRLFVLWDPEQRERWLHQLGRRSGRLTRSVQTRTLCL